MVILFIYKKTLKKEDMHCTCIIPGQDLGFALGCMSFRGLTPSLMLEYAISDQLLNFSHVILNPGRKSERENGNSWNSVVINGI